MRFLYKPFGLIAGIVGAKVGHRTFHAIWQQLDAAEPPDATAGDAPLGKVVAAAALQAATMAAIGAVVDRAAARAFHQLFGAWPGRTQAEKAAEEQD
jgi:hypothetical protein